VSTIHCQVLTVAHVNTHTVQGLPSALSAHHWPKRTINIYFQLLTLDRPLLTVDTRWPTIDHQHSTLDGQPSTVSHQHSTLDGQPLTISTQHSMVNCRPSVNTRHSMVNCQPSTLDTQWSTVDYQHSTLDFPLSTINTHPSMVGCQHSTSPPLPLYPATPGSIQPAHRHVRSSSRTAQTSLQLPPWSCGLVAHPRSHCLRTLSHPSLCQTPLSIRLNCHE